MSSGRKEPNMSEIHTIVWDWGADATSAAEITVYSSEQAQTVQELLQILDIPYTHRWEPVTGSDNDLPY